MRKLKGVMIGTGYFSQFHFNAWRRINEVDLVAVCDTDITKANALVKDTNVAVFTDYKAMIEGIQPDFIDIVTPPATHLGILQNIVHLHIPVMCQKAMAIDFKEALAIADLMKDEVFMLHENFRFQPWHREIKSLLTDQVIGEVFNGYFRMRMGDGWQEDAYLARQPYFRTMPRLLVYETAIHFIDTFSYLFGKTESVFAHLKKLNKAIAGEDFGIIHFNFANEVNIVFDGSRYNEGNHPNPRFTFGEFYIDGSKGTISLNQNGEIWIKPLGKEKYQHQYQINNIDFAGDCVFNIQKHFIQQLLASKPFETNFKDYIRNLEIQEAIYQSSEEKKLINIK